MVTTVKLTRSPKTEKKFRITLENGDTVDFGQKGYSDFTLHRNPLRMRSYVRRHGGTIPKSIQTSDDPEKVLKGMNQVYKSNRENWGRSGIRTPGFWSRWLLWSRPSLSKARELLRKRFGIKVVVN